MKKLLLLTLLTCSYSLTSGWNPVSDENTKKVKEFTINNSKTISAVGTGAIIILYVAYSMAFPSAPKPDLKVEDFFRV